jgi:hypothetical protein
MEYTSDTLLRVVERIPRPAAFLLNLCFPELVFSDSEQVSFDIEGGTKRITPLVSPLVAGKVVEAAQYTTGTLKPAYAKDKRYFDPALPFRRAIGETVGAGASLSPKQRRDAAVERYAADGVEMLTRRKRVMASEILRTGKLTLSGEGFKTVILDFQRPSANTVTLAGGARWNQTLASGLPNPSADLETWSALVDGGGTTVVMAPDTWSAMRARLIERGEDISLLGTLRGGNSSLDLGPQSVQDSRVNFIGTLGRFSLYTYSDDYVDDNGATQPLMPSGSLIMVTPDLLDGVQLHGAIRDGAAGFRAVEYFPKMWEEHDPAVEWWMLQSAPILAPFRPKASLGALTFG